MQNTEIRFTSSEDYTLAYIDYVDLKKNKDSYEGPTIPMTLLMSGDGSYQTPFLVNSQDPLVKSVNYFCEDVKVKIKYLNVLDLGHVHSKPKQHATAYSVA